MYEMSANGHASNFGTHNESSVLEDRSRNQNPDVGRAVTDAVHERFRQSYVYCENCKEKFIGNGVSIHKHFNKSHPADVQCIYCSGKVFHYYKVKNGNNKAEQVYYHWCRDWITK
ncbi:uncharacterized protein LOC107980745 [Nasonia vitripennis]|uniref:Uncharacterized protein n=1 Tax=Nasonia vitripennis TaxID=7425 RepID=A0A7M7J0X3_NASVI|nr:uncharacterized protein LOC107980745 [Nasonia vitripennis]